MGKGCIVEMLIDLDFLGFKLGLWMGIHFVLYSWSFILHIFLIQFPSMKKLFYSHFQIFTFLFGFNHFFIFAKIIYLFMSLSST